jgi:hypothetical protein
MRVDDSIGADGGTARRPDRRATRAGSVPRGARGPPEGPRRSDLARAPAPAEWAAVEIVCHLRDEEVEDFGARIKVVLEGGASFAPIDPERWAVERRYLEADGPQALVAIAPARLTTAVEHPRAGALSGLDLLAAWVTHDRLHLAQLASTLARLWATRWAPLRVDYAGPIPHANL